MSYSARAVASALLNRANRRRLLAFGLRVDAAFRRCRADDRARLEVAEPTTRVHAFGPLGDGHAHRDTRVCRPFDLQPSLNPLGRPSSPERVHDPGERRRVRHARGPARPSGRCSAFLRAAMAEWNGLDVPTRPSSSGAAVRDDTSRSRWTRTTGRVSARD